MILTNNCGMGLKEKEIRPLRCKKKMQAAFGIRNVYFIYARNQFDWIIIFLLLLVPIYALYVLGYKRGRTKK